MLEGRKQSATYHSLRFHGHISSERACQDCPVRHASNGYLVYTHVSCVIFSCFSACFVVSCTTANESCVSAQYVSQDAFMQLGPFSFKLLPTHLPAPPILQSLADWWLAQPLAGCASWEVWLAHECCLQLPAGVLRRKPQPLQASWETYVQLSGFTA